MPVSKGMGCAVTIDGAVQLYQHPELNFRPLSPQNRTDERACMEEKSNHFKQRIEIYRVYKMQISYDKR